MWAAPWPPSICSCSCLVARGRSEAVALQHALLVSVGENRETKLLFRDPARSIENLRHLADEFGVCPKTIRRRITLLKERGTISVESDTQGSIITILKFNDYQEQHTHKVPTDAHTDAHTDAPPIKEVKKERNIYVCGDQDLETLYLAYPKRRDGRAMNKAKGMQKLKRIITDQATYDRVLRAVNNFAAYTLRHSKHEFIPMWSTFVGNWEEWESNNQTQQTLQIDFGGPA